MDEKNSKKIDFLIKKVNELEERENNYRKTENKLNERIKELNCLFELSNLISNKQIDLDSFLQSVVFIIPTAFQFSNLTSARILFGEKEFLTEKFIESKHVISSKLILNDKLEGQIDVFCSKEKLTEDELIFLDEEIKLIEEISFRLCSAINSKRFEERIKKSESMLSLIISTIPQSIFWKDINGVYLGCNNSFAKIAGFKNPLDIIGKTDYELPWSKQESDAYRADDKYVVENIEAKLHIIEKITTHDKRQFIIDTSKVPLVDDSGNAFGLLGVFEDVTDLNNTKNELKISETKYKSIIESTSDFIWTVDPINFGIQTYNQSLYNYFFNEVGISLSVGDTPDVLVKSRINDWIYFYKKALELGKFETEYEVVSGKHFLYLSINTLVNDGEIFGISVLGRDITTLKQNERALIKAKEISEKNENNFREVLENSLDASYKRDLKNDSYTYLSPIFEKISGYGTSEFINLPTKDLLDLIHPDDIEHCNNIIIQSMESNYGTPYELEYRFKHKDGNYIWFLDRFIVMSDVLNNPSVRIGSVGDITNRKIMENALLESENKFKLAFMTSNDAIYIATIEKGLLIEANNAFYEIFGYTKEELKGKSALDLNIYYDINDRTKMISELKLNGHVKNMELKGLKKSGDEIIVSISTSLLNINNQQYILGFLRDITEDKKSELELIKSKEKAEENEKRITLLNLELEKRVAERTVKLENANKELESFSYSISHDLRAPLRAIDGFSKILISKHSSKLDKDAQSLVSRISGGAVKMSQLIDDILAFSRMNRYELKKSKIDMRLLVESIYNDITFEDEKIKISFILHDIPNSFGDEKVLRQVWVNLISNSIKFTSKIEYPIIEVGFKVENEKNIYFVKDNGVGFDMTYSGKLFNVFQRLHTESEYKGTGIGLAICKNIINKHGGKIWVESELNVGTTFYFYID